MQKTQAPKWACGNEELFYYPRASFLYILQSPLQYLCTLWACPLIGGFRLASQQCSHSTFNHKFLMLTLSVAVFCDGAKIVSHYGFWVHQAQLTVGEFFYGVWYLSKIAKCSIAMRSGLSWILVERYMKNKARFFFHKKKLATGWTEWEDFNHNLPECFAALSWKEVTLLVTNKTALTFSMTNIIGGSLNNLMI